MKQPKKIMAMLLAVILLFCSCQNSAAKVSSEDYYGVYTSEIGTLNYLVTNKSVDADAIAAFLDPLILVNKFGGLEPGMATSWEQSADGTTWTLKIRQNIKWQKWDGSEYGPNITAQDWVDAIEYILDPNMASLTADFVLSFIEGANDYYTARSEGGSPDFASVGVKALDEYTLEYKTTGVYPFFPSLLTYSCYLPINKQFVEEIGGIEVFGTDKDKILYYGEYLFKDWLRDQEQKYVKNDKYYLASRVHVNARNYVMVQDPKVALEMYKRGEVSSATIVSDQMDSAMADPELAPYVYRTSVSAASWYYYFNYGSPNANTVAAAQNVNFRKAVMSGLDRTTILSVSNKFDPAYLRRNTLNIWGLSVDENGKDYMTYNRLQEIEATDSYNPEAAKDYIAKAKQELGSSVTWPVTIVIAVQNTETQITVAEVTKQCIETASGGDILIDFNMYQAEDYYKTQEEGNFDLTSGGWIPDYADPASYLEINMVDGYIGARSGFANSPEWVVFDGLVREGKSKSVLSERFAILAEAEVYAIDNALVIPYRATGGNYAINKIQNPYDSTSSIAYGLCNSKWLDVRYGEKALTLEEREKLKEAFEKEKEAAAKK